MFCATNRTGFKLLHQLSVVLLYLIELDLSLKFLVLISLSAPCALGWKWVSNLVIP